jgi:epoxyqueuosine reductase
VVAGSNDDQQPYSALAAVAALIRGLNDSEPLIRGASAWALGQIGGDNAHRAIQQRLTIETDASVIEELQLTATSPAH